MDEFLRVGSNEQERHEFETVEQNLAFDEKVQLDHKRTYHV